MAELVDAPDLGSGLARGGGSSPLSRTIFRFQIFFARDFGYNARMNTLSLRSLGILVLGLAFQGGIGEEQSRGAADGSTSPETGLRGKAVKKLVG